jgi:glycosyltransferase involved in cell wall biosynthesis
MAQKPRCLFISLMRLDPAWQGNAKRALQLVQFYKDAGYELHFLYHAEEGYDEPSMSAYVDMFDQVFICRQSCPKDRAGEVFTLDEWYDVNLTDWVAKLQTRYAYDVIHANYVWYAPLFEKLPRDFVAVIDSHDVFADRHIRYIEAGMEPKWFYTSVEEENRALKTADVVLAIQRAEAEAFHDRGFENVICLPFMDVGLTGHKWRPPIRVYQEKIVTGYVGSANDWNILSMDDFLRALGQYGGDWPGRLLVAGAVSERIDHRLLVPRVTLLRHVDDLVAFYGSIDVALNPMVGGTGLKIKTIEALQFETPVLSTLDGMIGLEEYWRLPIFQTNDELVAYLLTQVDEKGAEAFLAEHRTLSSETLAALSREIEARTSELIETLDRFRATRQHRLAS